MNQVKGATGQVITWFSEKLAAHGLNSSSPPLTVASLTPTATDLVTVEALTSSKAIPGGGGIDPSNEFSVMVRVTASPQRQVPHTSVDVVAVLDISKSTDQDDRLERMKEAMMSVISKLGTDDGLSIVCFHHDAYCLTELREMSGQGLRAATDAINELAIADNTTSNMAAGLEKGAQVLRSREGKRSCRPGCIMLLSDTDWPTISEHTICADYRVHTFGLGPEHNPGDLKHIADQTFGTYSFVKKNITEAFALFIAGFKSVAVTSINITLSTHEGVTISSIEAGGFEARMLDEKSGEIEIADIYAAERKNFIVNLKVTGGDGKLLTVTARYQSLGESKVLAGMTEMCALQPPEELLEIPEVAAELARVELLKAQLQRLKDVLKMQTKPVGDDGLEPKPMGDDRLQEIWAEFKASVAGGGYPEDVAKMDQLTGSGDSESEAEPDDQKRSKLLLAYMMSWLSCHQLQRANTKGTPSSTGAFVASGTASPPPTNFGNSCSCLRRDHAVLLVPFLFLASLLYLYSGGHGGLGFGLFGRGSTMIKVPTSTANTTALDLSGHPHWWPVMEQDFEVMIRKTEDAKVTSFFQEASVKVMNDQMDRYLYLAIVHATALRRHHAGYAISDAAAVRSAAGAYLQDMVERMRDVDLPSFEDASPKLMNKEMNRYLYSTIVQSSVVWSHTERFHEDSMVTEVTKDKSIVSTTVNDKTVLVETEKETVSTTDGKTVVVATENGIISTIDGKTVLVVAENAASLTTVSSTDVVVVAAEMAKATVRITELEKELVHKMELETRVEELEREMVRKTWLEARVAELEKEMVHKTTLEVRVTTMAQQLLDEKTVVVSLRSELATQRKSCAEKCSACDTNVKSCGEMVAMWKARVVELGGSVEEEEVQPTVTV